MSIRSFKLFCKKHIQSLYFKKFGTYARKNISFLNPYRSVKLSDKDIGQETYKNCLGGGAEKWELRGRVQLFFLQREGLSPKSKFIDVGCGPIRAGIHFINYLDEGNYFGVDYNEYFIRAAEKIVEQQNLQVKNPKLQVIHGFRMPSINNRFDYGIAFSVLNHCGDREREDFFRMMVTAMKHRGLFYISHAKWFDESRVSGKDFKITRRFGSSDFDIRKFGWEDPEAIFPILKVEIERP